MTATTLQARSIAYALALASLLCTAGIGCRDSATNNPGATAETATENSDSEAHYAFVTNGVADFWKAAVVGARQAAKEANADITIIMPDGMTDQTRKLEDLITRGVDGVAVSPINAENQVDILNRVAEATSLVTHDSDVPKSNRLAYVGMDNYKAGLMCGKIVRDSLPEGGTVMLFIGRMDQDNAQYRRQGCIDGILGRGPDSTRRDPTEATPKSENGKYQVLGTLTDRFDRAKAKSNVEDTLIRHPDISAMVGLFEYNPPAILEALERAGKLGDVKVIGFDENEVTLQGIKDGTVVATVVQDPFQYGYQSVSILAGLKAGDESVVPEGGYIDVPPRTIDKENVDEFWAKLNESLNAE